MTSPTPDAQAEAAFERYYGKADDYKKLCRVVWLAAFAQGQVVGAARRQEKVESVMESLLQEALSQPIEKRMIDNAVAVLHTSIKRICQCRTTPLTEGEG